MIPLSSKLESREQEFSEVKQMLERHRFALGGSWDYKNGSFDRPLDEAQKVWLRLPFAVTNGNLDGEASENDAKIQFYQPFVLRHLYNEGVDGEAQPRVLGSLIDQFQSPVDPDASVSAHWVAQAEQTLREVENLFPDQTR
ncbi:hypothetical protein IDH44_11190 [Paenibacillus sp. IB182496]|uniref:YugN-like protein n=1 Tax=Paenibacillus sabuli TaxID=2772509 RepID=A0A927BS36_9BACL|nr:YugN family protein [Paenibacillus sabuli]MBD2845756.1 hypothetical protein [Paenibacillus sabuli]